MAIKGRAHARNADWSELTNSALFCKKRQCWKDFEQAKLAGRHMLVFTKAFYMDKRHWYLLS